MELVLLVSGMVLKKGLKTKGALTQLHPYRTRERFACALQQLLQERISFLYAFVDVFSNFFLSHFIWISYDKFNQTSS